MARLLPVLSVLLWDIQQRKLRLSPFEQHGMAFTLVVAESDILPINVSVTRLQLPDQRAFGYLSASQESVRTDIVCKRGKEQLSKPQHYPKNTVFYSVNHSVIG